MAIEIKVVPVGSTTEKSYAAFGGITVKEFVEDMLKTNFNTVTTTVNGGVVSSPDQELVADDRVQIVPNKQKSGH